MVYLVLRVMCNSRFGGWEFYDIYSDRASAKKFVTERNANDNRQYNYRFIARKPKSDA